MAAVRRADTRPEVVVRRLLHRMGLRFRLQRGDLPGRPDIVLPRRRTIIFVHGCFWHRHPRCKKTTTPASNRAFWLAKFAQNRKRDRRVQAELQARGWRVLVIWQCQTGDLEQLADRLRSCLEA
jgi:DNA mismatch endonuclease, patch repair protein